MIKQRTWKEFRDSKLLWVVNRTLHLFGWAIVFNFNDAGEIVEVFPARVKFRGFDEKSETDGFIGLSKYLEENITEIRKESEE